MADKVETKAFLKFAAGILGVPVEKSAKLPEVTVAAFPPNLDAYFPPVKGLFERFGFVLESFTESEKAYSKLLNL